MSKEHHKHRETGGVNEAEEDLKDKPEARTNAKKIDDEAEERKAGGKVEGGKKHGDEHHHEACKCKRCMGGRAKRKRGGGVGFGPENEATKARATGGVVHHEKPEHMKHAKHVGKVEGHGAKAHLGRAPRKSGGRTGADSMPYSSARHGIDPPDHKTDMGLDD